MVALSTQDPLFAQRRPVTVPFVGCKSDGQVGPQAAPDGSSQTVRITESAAQKLAYYASAQGLGVLAPRGWYCFGLYGSSGESLFVSPQPINSFPSETELAGPVIEISHTVGDSSGRSQVADVIARVFPAYKAFVQGVIKDSDQPARSFPSGPYPKDTLRYKSKTVVEYKTPAQTEGLGTRWFVKKNDSAIEGVAILIGRPPDLLFLSARLPSDPAALTATIMDQFERDAARSTF